MTNHELDLRRIVSDILLVLKIMFKKQGKKLMNRNIEMKLYILLKMEIKIFYLYQDIGLLRILTDLSE